MKLFREFSAWVPVAMSGFVVAMLWSIFFLNRGVIVREPDEGVPAHVFQLLMFLQIPIVAYFAFKWLPRAPREAMQVLALQIAAAVAAAAPVFILRL